MGYLSQKKRQANIKEMLNISLVALGIFCLLFLFFKETEITEKISPWLFDIYIYALLLTVFAVFNRFFWQAIILVVVIFIFFLQIGMGTNLFTNVQTPGLQNMKIFYQTNVKNNHDSLKLIERYTPGIAVVHKKSRESIPSFTKKQIQKASQVSSGFIVSEYPFSRSGEILLSRNGRAGFANIKVGISEMIFISLDFSNLSKEEIKISLKNLAEFINMQDIPAIVVGDFGIEAWSHTFLSFLEKTKLEVKNKIIPSDGKYLINPLKAPTFSVLAYKDFGVRKITFLSKKSNPKYPLLIELNY